MPAEKNRCDQDEDGVLNNKTGGLEMATKEVKARELAGEDLSGKVWTAEKPYMLVRYTEKGAVTTFYVSDEDFEFAVKKAEKNQEEIVYAAKVEAFQKIGDFKSGFGRKFEISDVLYID